MLFHMQLNGFRERLRNRGQIAKTSDAAVGLPDVGYSSCATTVLKERGQGRDRKNESQHEATYPSQSKHPTTNDAVGLRHHAKAPESPHNAPDNNAKRLSKGYTEAEQVL